MIIYLDTSSLIKLYVEENGSRDIEAALVVQELRSSVLR